MTIEGPSPAYNPYQNYPAGSSQLPNLSMATFCSQLSAAAPTAATPSNSMSPAQQNTFWFFRMYGDLSMLYFFTSISPNSAMAQNYVNDLKFIQTQVTTEKSLNFDPSLINDLQTYISNPSSLSIGTIITNYNSIIADNPNPPYSSANYDFQNLTPDDMYNYYLIQLGIGIYNGTQSGNPQNQFWQLTPGSATLLATQMGQFFCSYFVQRDGWNTSALTNDINAFMNIMAPIIQYVGANYTKYQAMNAALTYGYDPSGNYFKGLAVWAQDLQKGQWDYQLNGQNVFPDGSNNCPPPLWDITSSTQVQWDYETDYTFLQGNDFNLYMYLENLQ